MIGDPLLLAVLALLATYAVLLVVRWPWLALLAIVVLIPFNGLVSQMQPGYAGIYGPLKDAFLGLLLVVAAARGGLGRLPWQIRAGVWTFVILGGVAALRAPSLVEGLYGWRNDYFPFLLLLAAPAVLNDRTARFLAGAIVGLAQVAAVVTWVTWRQGLTWMFTVGILPSRSDAFPFQYFMTNSNTPRAFSPYVAPNEAGCAMAIVVAVIWTVPGWSRRRRLLCTPLPIAALYATHSRSALLGLVVLALVLLAFRASQRPGSAASVVVPLAAGAVVVAGALKLGTVATDGSFLGHANSLRQLPGLIAQYPLGAGTGRVGPRAERFEPHPILVESFWGVIALEASLLVLLVFLATLLLIVRYCLKARSLAAFMAPAVLAASLVSQLVLPTLQEGAVSYLLWTSVSLGLFWALAKREADRRAPETAVGRPVVAMRGS